MANLNVCMKKYESQSDHRMRENITVHHRKNVS